MMISSILLGLSCAAGQVYGREPLAKAAVHSREWRMRRSPREEEEFIGNVGYAQGGSILNADWALYAHSTRRWQARGHVRARQRFANGDLLDAQGDRADYDMNTEEGSLQGPPGRPVALRYSNETGDLEEGTAGLLSWRGKRSLVLDNGFILRGKLLDAQGRRADMDMLTQSLRLSGARPVVRVAATAWTGALKADRVEAGLAGGLDRAGPQSLEAHGGVEGWVIFKNTPRAPH